MTIARVIGRVSLLLGFSILSVAGAQAQETKAAPPITLTLLTKDTVVAADGSTVQTTHVEERAENSAVAPQISQPSIAYDADMQDLAVVEAHTLKADGKTIPVEPGAIYEKLAPGIEGADVTSLRSKVIVFPQVSGGDSIVYTIRLTTRKPHFPGQFFDGDLFDRTLMLNAARETVTAPKSMALAVENHDVDFSKKDDGDSVVYSWHYSQTAPLAEAPVTYTPLAHAPRFFATSFADYAALGRAYAALTQDKRGVTPKVRALAEQLTAGVTDPKAQAQKLYEWVSGHIRYVGIELGQGSLVPHDVDAILANGYGDCKDHDILLQSLLAAKNIASQSVLINGTENYEMTAVATLTSLNHVITYIPQFKLYADSTAKVAPFGVLPINEYGKPMVLVSATAAALGTMPLMPPGFARASFKSDMALDKNGVITGTATTTASGPYSIALRSVGLGIQAVGTQAMSKTLTAMNLKDGEGSFTQSLPTDMAPDYSISGSFKYGGLDKEASGATRFYMPAALRLSGLPGAAAMGPIEPGKLKDDEATLCFSVDESDDIALKAPAESEFGDAPKDVRVETPNLTFTAHYALDGDTMRLHRQFTSRIDTLYCSGEVRKRTAAALKQILDSYDAEIWLQPAQSQEEKKKTAGFEAAYKQAQAHYDAAKYDLALQDFEKIVAIDPANAIGYFGRGMIDIQQNLFAQAVVEFDHAIELNGGDYRYFEGRGQAYLNLNEPERAIADESQSLKLAPVGESQTTSFYVRASAYLQTSRFDLAIADCNSAIALKPDFGGLYLVRGMAEQKLGRQYEANQDTGRATKLDASIGR